MIPRLAVLLVVLVAAAGCGNSHSAKGQRIPVRLVDSGCSPASVKAHAGTATFVVESDTSKVTEFELKDRNGVIIGERENIVEGIPGTFTLRLEPGTYVMSCPNGDAEDQGTLVVDGAPTSHSGVVASAELSRATSKYRDYVVSESDQLLAGTKKLVAALEAGDTAQAKALFGPTRMHYEAIEPVAESFGKLDPEIDARINDVPSITSWTGFHRIERMLWKDDTTAGTEPYADKLLADVTTLDQRVRTLEFQPAQLANGAVELLNEVARSKITGEEDRYSHTDLADFQGNLSGAAMAFALLEPALAERGHGALANTITQRFAAVQTGLDAYKRPTPLGYALYDSLTPSDRRALAQKLDALAEPLSTVAAFVSS